MVLFHNPSKKDRDRASAHIAHSRGIRTSFWLVRALDVVFQGSNGYASGYTATAQLSEARRQEAGDEFRSFGRLADAHIRNRRAVDIVAARKMGIKPDEMHDS